MASSISYVQKELLEPLPAPVTNRGVYGWVKQNLFATPRDAVLSILAILLLVWMIPPMFEWLFYNAVWSGDNRSVCATIVQGGIQPDGWSGACWGFVNAKFSQFMVGRYPPEETWRPILVAIGFVVFATPMLIPSAPRKGLNAVLLFIVYPIFSFILLYGGLGLEVVETPLWGGFMVTLVLSFVGIGVSLPFGILLALGRKSQLPFIRIGCVMFIELFRGVPLITVLFMANVMLPLFLPAGTSVDKLVRPLVGIAIFTSAYMAEIIRGGLQAIPKGQYEGADSLGLSYWHKIWLIILPQAIKVSIPGIVNTFIGMFKDTTLVSIIGMFDLLGIVKLNFGDANWATPVTAKSGLIFTAFVFWIFCFGMSRYSQFMERHLDTGHKR